MNKPLIIAIDGHSSSGKSTLAKAIAKKLGILYFDSGATYRAIARYAIDEKIDVVNEPHKLVVALKDISVELQYDPNVGNIIFLNGTNITNRIRLPEITNIVSEVAAISEVRKKLVDIQRACGDKLSLVMDGRDIGSVVFPNAQIKLFVTANEQTRAQRRLQELLKKHIDVEYDQVLSNLKHRDQIDSNRADSPLIQAQDAIFLDNSELNQEQQLNEVLRIINQNFPDQFPSSNK